MEKTSSGASAITGIVGADVGLAGDSIPEMLALRTLGAARLHSIRCASSFSQIPTNAGKPYQHLDTGGGRLLLYFACTIAPSLATLTTTIIVGGAPLRPAVAEVPPTLEEFDPLNPGEWQLG
ncbi:hypothetical protein ANCDUO_23182, partial [Ancylostoma duodenale]